MLNEINQTMKEKYWLYYLYVESKNKLVDITKKKETHRYREQISGYSQNSRGATQEWGIEGYKLTHIK